MTGGRRDRRDSTKAAHRREATATKGKAQQKRAEVEARRRARAAKKAAVEAARQEKQRRRDAREQERAAAASEREQKKQRRAERAQDRERRRQDRDERREKLERATEFVAHYQPQEMRRSVWQMPPPLPDCKVCGHTEHVHGVVRGACMAIKCNCGHYEPAAGG